MNTKGRNTMNGTDNTARRRAAAPSREHSESEVQVHYTPAKPFNRNRFLLRLAIVGAMVLAVVLGMSIFFKTRQITVSGTEKYTPWEVKEASGIQDGDSLLSLSEARISARIRAALPYIGDVRVGIKLPDTVNIEVTELAVVYAVEDSSGAWWLMDAAGRIVDKTDATAAGEYTRIVGIKLRGAAIGKQAVAAETEGAGNTAFGTPAEQLNSAKQILVSLESNGILGKIVTVDVTDTSQLGMWYADRYEVNLGNADRMDYKIASMKAAIQKMGEYQTGYLDVSFTTWPNQVYHRPFE